MTGGLAEITVAAGEVEAFCRERHWRFCFIGGIAVQRWGMPRFTQDVDVTLLTGLGMEEQFIDPLLRRFQGRLPEARQFAIDHRVLLARTAGGVDLDIALGAFPFDQTAIENATLWKVSDAVSLTTCSAEDLVIQKAFAARDRDWADLESVLSRQHGRLDLGYIRKQLSILLDLKGNREDLQKLDRRIELVGARVRK